MTAAVAVLYWAFLAGVDITFFASARAVGGAALVLGMGTCMVGSAEPTGQATKTTGYRLLGFVGAVALLAGLITLITGNEIALAVVVEAVVALRFVATLRHAIVGRHWAANSRQHGDLSAKDGTRLGAVLC